MSLLFYFFPSLRRGDQSTVFCIVSFDFNWSRALFLERPGNLTGPVSYFEIKVSRRVGCVLTSNEVQFVSLADNFTVQFLNLLKLSSGMENKTP